MVSDLPSSGWVAIRSFGRHLNRPWLEFHRGQPPARRFDLSTLIRNAANCYLAWNLSMATMFRIFTIALVSTNLFASPTAEDFRHCHRITAAALEACLNENPGSQNTTRCFKESSGVLSRCVAEIKSPQPLSGQRREAVEAAARCHARQVAGECRKQDVR